MWGGATAASQYEGGFAKKKESILKIVDHICQEIVMQLCRRDY